MHVLIATSQHTMYRVLIAVSQHKMHVLTAMSQNKMHVLTATSQNKKHVLTAMSQNKTHKLTAVTKQDARAHSVTKQDARAHCYVTKQDARAHCYVTKQDVSCAHCCHNTRCISLTAAQSTADRKHRCKCATCIFTTQRTLEVELVNTNKNDNNFKYDEQVNSFTQTYSGVQKPHQSTVVFNIKILQAIPQGCTVK